MKKLRTSFFQFILVTYVMLSCSVESSAAEMIKANGFCTDQEKWSVPKKYGQKWVDLISEATSDSDDYEIGFKAAFLAKTKGTGFVKEWGEYWIWRSYLSLGLVHLSHRGFDLILSQAKGVKPTWTQKAALVCQSQLKMDYPTLAVSSGAVQSVMRWKRVEESWKLITQVFLQRLSDGAPNSELQNYLDFLKGTGSYEAFAFGAWYAHLQRPAEAVKNFEFILAQKDNPTALPPLVKDQLNLVKLLLARQYHELKKYDKAIQLYSSVEQSSNHFAQSLTEQSWSHLLNENRSRAVGAAFGLGLGKVRDTFNPDAPVVMAISLFEICQFVESYRMVRLFKSLYEPVYQWLYDWNKRRESGAPKGESLYQMAVNSLKGVSAVPDKVASEWARSPYFLTYQSELNLWYDEQSQIKRYLKVLSKADSSENSTLSVPLKKTLYSALTNFMGEIPNQQKNLVSKIETELSRLNVRMLRYLADTADNAQLVEVEIFNAASEGILNSEDQPKVPRDVKQLAQKSVGREWRFGRFPAANDKAARTAEVWDDEIDSLVADLKDRCPRPDLKKSP